jgi:hypothetical protein
MGRSPQMGQQMAQASPQAASSAPGPSPQPQPQAASGGLQDAPAPQYPGGVLPRRVQTADNEEQTQALEQGLGMMPQAQTAGNAPDWRTAQASPEQFNAQIAQARGQGAGQAPAPQPQPMQVAKGPQAAPASAAPAPSPQDPVKAATQNAPPSPEAAKGPSTQKALAQQNFNYWTKMLMQSSALGDHGKGLEAAAKENIDLAKQYLTPTEIQRNLGALGIDPRSPAGQSIMLNAMPDTRPEAMRIGELSLDPKTKPLYNAAIEVKQAGARTGEDAYNQTVGTAAGKIVGTELEKYANGYDEAYKMHKQLSLMEQAARDPNVMQGAGGTAWLGVQKVAQQLGKAVGMNTDDLTIANAEQLNKFARQYASQQAKSGVGARVTNFELDTFLKSNAGNDTSQLGNIRLIGILKQDAERQMEISNQVADLSAKKKEDTTISDIRKIARSYDEAHPLVDPITGKAVGEVAAESGPAKASEPKADQPKSAPVKVFTKSDYDKVKPGDTYIDPTGKMRTKGGSP